MPQNEPLVRVYRGGVLESEHRGAIAITDAEGRLVAHAGDPDLICFLRSSAKPFQVVPVVSSGAADRFGFTEAELALMAGSHSGEDRHIDGVISILNKIGIPETALLCGSQIPFSEKAFQKLLIKGQKETILHNNCSSKHAGMLAIASDWGSSTDDYLSENHPVQRAIKEAICDISGVREQDIIVAVDGCSAPTFALPLVNIARSFGRLASPPQKGPACAPSQPTVKSVIGKGRTWNRSGALAKVAEVMIKHPEMVGGEGRFDTELMRLLPRKVVTKGGAEGVQGVGVLAPSVRKGLQNPFGIAIKVMDGAGGRTLPMIAVEILDQLGVVGPDDLTLLKEKFDRRIKNHRGVPVGEIKTCFQLKWI